MIFDASIIKDIKEKSGLKLDNFGDYSLLAEDISSKTSRSIGLTTLRRLFGIINDDRKTSSYTLNTIAMYLGYNSWDEYFKQKNLDSEWNFEDDKIVISRQPTGTHIHVRYLNRKVEFVVTEYDSQKVLRVEKQENSSLDKGDILFVHSLKKGSIIEADKVIRGTNEGSYKTHGEITSIEIV